eukprot:CAMPEP_0203680022 /NCGR_PEP_ID=MMETSP0090-20130426/37799_1 /ASSEMBLY_ACC=CAM_ASM_001088 /TAXON_ID=426623 /ORGANISM="Chaetoceros affinis, Strain CCMP159" /LENGTH=479 /DNA_ID=CAMNT_0050547905 /DNA_START=230 /DNA_END=1670 /DNA_ORIENTATION=+
MISPSTSLVGEASGNKAWCTAQGFFIQLGLIVPSYSAMLCIYYMFVIKYNMRDEKITKYEPYMHAFAILPSLIISIVALSNGLYNNYHAMCWISDGENSADLNVLLLILRSSVLAMIFIIFIITIATMTSVVLTVREREEKMKQYSFRQRANARGVRVARSNLSKTTADTKKQALIYVVGLTVTYIFTAIILIWGYFSTSIPYPLLILQGIFLPLQGFWNFLAYVRPRFSMVSTDYPEKNFFQKLSITILKKPEEFHRSSRSVQKSFLRPNLREITKKEMKGKKGSSSERAGSKKVRFPLSNLANEEKEEISRPENRTNADIEYEIEVMNSSCTTPYTTTSIPDRTPEPNEEGHEVEAELEEDEVEAYCQHGHASLSWIVAQDFFSSTRSGQYRRRSLGSSHVPDASFTMEALQAHQENLSIIDRMSCNSSQIHNSTENDRADYIERASIDFQSVSEAGGQRNHRRHSCPSVFSGSLDE